MTLPLVPAPPALEPMQVSVSQLEQFSETPESCKGRWWLKHVARLPEPGSPATAFGNLFHALRRRWLEGADGDALYPEGWDRGFSPVDADLARRLLKDAIERKVLRRLPTLRVEYQFKIPLLPPGFLCIECGGEVGPECAGEGHAAVPLPEVRIKGVVDQWHLDGIVDDKTTASEEWAKGVRHGPEALSKDLQLRVYGRVWLGERRGQGLPDPQVVSLAHAYYFKREGKARLVYAEPPVTPADLERTWDRVREVAAEMRLLRAKLDPKAPWGNQASPEALELADARTAALFPAVPRAELDRSKILSPPRNSPCGAYKGCTFREICGGIRSPAAHRAIVGARALPLTSAEPGAIVPNSTLFDSKLVDSPPILPDPTSNRPDSKLPEVTFSQVVHSTLPDSNQSTRFDSKLPDPSAFDSNDTRLFEGGSRPVMSIFAARLNSAPGGGAALAEQTPPPGLQPGPQQGLQPSPQPAPQQAPPVASGPPTPPVQAPPAASLGLIPGAPPWARTDDMACRVNGYNTGISTVGDGCKTCASRQAAESRVQPGHFRLSFDAATQTVSWEALEQFREPLAAAGVAVSGRIHAPWVKGGLPAPSLPASQPAPASAPQPAPALPQPGPAPAAPGGPALFGTPAPAPQPAPVLATGTVNAQSGTVTVNQAGQPKKPKAVRFVLCMGCSPIGGNDVVRLEALFQKWAAELAKDSKVESYFNLPAFDRGGQPGRRDLLAAAAEEIVNDDGEGAIKLANRYLVVPAGASPDLRAFADALRPFADDVIEALQA